MKPNTNQSAAACGRVNGVRHENSITVTFILSRVLTILLCLNISYGAFSQIYYVKPTGNDFNNGGSWATAFASIQKALVVATPGSKILIAAGTYYPDEGFNAVDNLRTSTFMLKNQVSLYGGFEPEIGIDDLNDTRVKRSRLSGDLLQDDAFGVANVVDNAFHVVTAPIAIGISISTVLDGFIVTEGNANGGGVNNNGGGMYIDVASLTISNCIFFANRAALGGGIYNANGNPLFFNCEFTQNQSHFGGGIYSNNGNPGISNCSFINNTGSSQGGGIYNSSSGSIITNCALVGNAAQYGAGLYNNNSAVNITNCTIYDNNSTTSGGGIYNETAFLNPAAPPKIFNCIIWGNSTAIYNSITVPEVSHSIVQGGYPGVNNKDLDPLFVNAANDNLRLQACSPAINAGLNSANTTAEDLDGNARIFGTTIDMGCFEAQATSCCPQGNVFFVKKDATGDNDGTSWDDAFTSLQDALAKTSQCATVTQIWVAAGTYYPDEGLGMSNDDRAHSFVMKNNLAIYGGFAGTETLLSERNWHINTSILSGEIQQDLYKGNNSYHVVQSGNVNNTAILDGFTIREGNAVAFNASDIVGGGMSNNSSSPVISNCVFSNNTAIYGAGMANTSASPTVVNCSFTDNLATSQGGGIWNASGSSPVVVNSIFSSNTAYSGGGGIFNGFSSPNLKNCSFSLNTSLGLGGVLHNNYSSPQVTNCILWGNSGGQVYNFNGAAVISYSIVQGGYGGTNNLDLDPFFMYGTDGLRLKSCSPAIDKGLNSANTTTVDPDDNPRVFNTLIDMGAYEFQGTVQPMNLVCPADITVSADQGQCNAVVNFTGNNAATASPCATLTYSPASGSVFNLGATTVTVTAVDGTGNSSTCSFTVTVVDNEAPVIIPFADLTIECSGLTPANLQVTPLLVTSPASLAKNYNSSGSTPYGDLPSVPIIANLQLVNDGVGVVTDACDGIIAPGSLTGKIALIDRGDCTFNLKVKRAQDAGALAVVFINNTPGDELVLPQVDDPAITIPAIIVSNNTGNAFKTALLTGPVTVSIWNKNLAVTNTCGAMFMDHFSDVKIPGSCPNSYQLVRSWTVSDNSGNTASTTQTVTVQDHTAPVITCPVTGTVTRSTTAGLCTYAIADNEFDPQATDNCSTPSLAWTITGATTSNGTGSLATVKLNYGSSTITWQANDGCGNSSTCSFIVNVNKITTTTSLVVSTAPASNPVKQQYSDKITCVATVTPATCAGNPIGGTVTFKIINNEGTVVLGSAAVGANRVATLTDTLLESQLYPGATNLIPTNGPLKPGNKTVTAVYSNTDANYIVTNPTAPLIVTCEDAEITYNGLNYFGANPNTNQGTITVSAFVLDTNDVNDNPAQARGDIRNATVTFKEGTSGGTTIGTANIPVGLVNPTNYQQGIVTTNKVYTLTTQDINCGGKIIDVWGGAGNYYCGEFDEVVPVCLSLPGGDYVTGGGWINMQNSEGSYAGTDDKKMHAALVFKWNKSNKNLQGNATIIYKRIVNGVQKVYQIKSNSITSMIVNNVNNAGTAVTTGATYRMALIVTKANFRDLTDPDFPITLFGNLTLTITAWESISVTDGSQDRISIQLVGSGSQGLIFSSNWLSGATQWQQLNSGKMRVRNPSSEIPCTTCSGSGTATKTGEVDKAAEVPKVAGENLKVVAMPNPSSTNFKLVIQSNKNVPIKMQVVDMMGRIIEQRILQNEQIITLGDKYRPGVYLVKITQDDQSRQLKLIKLPE